MWEEDGEGRRREVKWMNCLLFDGLGPSRMMRDGGREAFLAASRAVGR